MVFRIDLTGLLSLVCVSVIVIAIPVVANDSAIIPSLETLEALKKLPLTTEEMGNTTESEYLTLEFDLDQTLSSETGEVLALSTEHLPRVSFAALDTIILQFESDVSAGDIWDYVRRNNLSVTRVFPELGAIQVKADLRSYFESSLAYTNQEIFRAMRWAIDNFESDSRIRSASLDILLSRQSDRGEPAANINTEITDWGILDIEADKIWDMPLAKEHVFLGVLDTGFSQHEDISFRDLPPLPQNKSASHGKRADHGNHVAAIACGKHNGVGVRGVLPNCSVQPRSIDLFFKDAKEERFAIQQFTQIIPTLIAFVSSQQDVRTFNVSLGYNWQGRFGLDPELSKNADLQKLIKSQGLLMVSLLKMAENNDKIIFSAAGNDSSDSHIRNARFASPFNYAAIMAREEGIARNGIIVEAHDANGQRGTFSNAGGHISCPGVAIYSACALDPQGQWSESAYCTKSGTSMAAPHCTAGHLLFRLVRRGYSAVEAADCLRLSSLDSSSTGTPMLRLTRAVAACPKKTSH